MSNFWVLIEDGQFAGSGKREDGVPIGAVISYETEAEREAAWPQCKAVCDDTEQCEAERAIDNAAGVNIPSIRAKKLFEADLIKYQGVTDSERIPTLHGEAAKRSITLMAMADLVYEKHNEDAVNDNSRIEKKLAL